MVGSTAILETRAVVKLACFSASTTVVKEQLYCTSLTNLLDFERKCGEQTSTSVLFNIQFLPLKWQKFSNLTPWTHML